ncbi:hypothetical protein HRM2_28200 [Desulforapulum autotrophicum HRM2]|uniref:Uncharacterized protein n=1 Tax=Desulforapulum autotrophicum (strain ATCC 43914 / DSM 3382 / VKM B-1955 / HRM2) TaxID=177437 RepID=C0QJ96_DESAH|nr:hypothetical protein HRM2_28200 [Desulforapulum autotrophicum HRM2]
MIGHGFTPLLATASRLLLCINHELLPRNAPVFKKILGQGKANTDNKQGVGMTVNAPKGLHRAVRERVMDSQGGQ